MKTLSASQISTYQSCARAWSFSYIDGKRPPGTKATQLGQSIHTEMENWLRHGTAPTSPQARALMAHAPAPGIADVEHAVNLQTPNSLWRGFADLLHDLNEDGSAAKAFTTGHTLLGDWKTSSSLSWAKSAEYLAEEDTQAALYAAYAFSKGAERVSGRWVYATTRGAVKVHPVNFIFSRDVVQKNLDALDCVAKEVQKLYTLRKKTNELAPNFAHCESYGGCAHKAYCDRSPVQGAISMSDSTDFASFISARFPSVSPAVPTSSALDTLQNVVQKDFRPTVSINPPPVPSMGVPPPPVPPTFVPPPPPPPPVPRPLTEESTDSRTFEFLAQTVGAKAAERIIGQVKAESVLPPPVPPAFNTTGVNQMLFDAGTRPLVEHGVINSPEGPLYAPASPEEAAVMTPVVDTSEKAAPDVLDTMDRTALKALNIRLGLCTESSRFQEPKLRANVREYAQTHGVPIASVLDLHNLPLKVGGDEQLEANRDIDTNIGLSMGEREAVSAASQSISSGQTDDELLDKIEGIVGRVVTARLNAFFAERFGQ